MPVDVAKDASPKPPEAVLQNRGLIFVAALASVFITSVESTIVSTSMPTIVGALGGFELLSWVFTAYLLTQAVSIPIYGRFADLYGRKPILLIGLALFLAGSILCGLAWNMGALVLFRVLQGMGAGSISSVSRTLIGDIYHGADRARMQGYVSGTFVSAAVSGPLIGSFLTAHTSWPMVFWVNIPIGCVAGLILITVLHETIERREHRIDWGGSVLIALGAGLLMFALSKASSLGAPLSLTLGAAAILALVVFVLHERRVAEPIWPMSLWRNGIGNRGNLVSLALGATTMGIAAYLPVYMQDVMGLSTFITGLTIMAMSASGPIGAFCGGQIMLRSSFRTSACSGGLIYITGTLFMWQLAPDSGPYWAVMSGLMMGFGIGMNNNTYMVAIQADSGWHQRGIATGAFMFCRILGQAMGAAAFGGVLNARLSAYLGAGGEDLVSRLSDSHSARGLAPEVMAPLLGAFDGALHVIFTIMIALALTVFAVGVSLPARRGLLQNG
jgi:EmrB/QacA subfamily drug resistance transporter